MEFAIKVDLSAVLILHSDVLLADGTRAMTRLRLSDVSERHDVFSPLAVSLMHLHAPSGTVREKPLAKPNLGMIDWQSQWSQNQDQITRRLRMIEDELDKLVATEMPPLSVVAAD